MMKLTGLIRTPAVYLIAAMVIWGSSFATMKLAVAVYDPLITFARLLIASLVFIALRSRFGSIRYRPGRLALAGLDGAVRAGAVFRPRSQRPAFYLQRRRRHDHRDAAADR